MLKRLYAAILWSRMVGKYLAGDYADAAACADRYREIGRKHRVFLALDATLDILNGRSGIAEDKFSELAKALSKEKGNNSVYIRMYADYYLCLIQNGPACDSIREAARKLPAAKRVKRRLQFPDRTVE